MCPYGVTGHPPPSLLMYSSAHFQRARHWNHNACICTCLCKPWGIRNAREWYTTHSRHDVFLMSWRTHWRHGKVFDIMTCFWHHDEVFDIMTYFSAMTNCLMWTCWRVDEYVRVMTCFCTWWRTPLTSWRISDVIRKVLTSWRVLCHDVFLTSWRTFWHHDVFLRHDKY